MYETTLKCFRPTIAEVGKQWVLHMCTGVFAAVGIQHATRMRHVVTCGLPGSTILFHIMSP